MALTLRTFPDFTKAQSLEFPINFFARAFHNLRRARPMPRGGETRCVPRFYVIGAMKAGTTTVSTWLHALGEPLSIRPKEVHFWPVAPSPATTGPSTLHVKKERKKTDNPR